MRGILANQPEALEERCNAFFLMHAWPHSNALNWRGWLSNFRPDELQFARCLLEAFCYFGPVQSAALLISAFHGISRDVVKGAASGTEARHSWESFLDRVVVTHVEGEKPSPADSGFAFTRGAREVLAIPERRVVFVHKALEIVMNDPNAPVVFVDDLAGSGQQMEKTWIRKRPEVFGQSFDDAKPKNVWYTPLVGTWKAQKHLARHVPALRFKPAHLLTPVYSAVSDESLIWPAGAHAEGRAFIKTASERAGFVEKDAHGFHELALCLAVNDTIPDFTLPLFYSTRNGWIPLMRRKDPNDV